MRVFLSYSLGPGAQALAWRLQTLAAAHGIRVDVPRRKTYQISQAEYDGAHKQDLGKMARADCVLLIVAADNQQARLAIRDEVNQALGRKKLIIPIVKEGLEHRHAARGVLEEASVPTFILSLKDGPGSVEGEIAQYLKSGGLAEAKQRAVQALVAIALGLVSLTSLAEK